LPKWSTNDLAIEEPVLTTVPADVSVPEASKETAALLSEIAICDK
jgi:hypothetical protein